MDIRLQNALINKYALKVSASPPSTYGKHVGEPVEPPSRGGTQPTSINFDEMNPLARYQMQQQINATAGKTRYHRSQAQRRENILNRDFDYAAKAQDKAKATKSEEEETAASAAGRASLRDYLNPTSSLTGNMALYGGGGALLGGGLATLLSSPRNRKRNALLYALLGGGLGIGAKMLGDRYAAEPAAAEPESKGLLQSALSYVPKMPSGILPGWMGGDNVDLVKTPTSTTIAGRTDNDYGPRR